MFPLTLKAKSKRVITISLLMLLWETSSVPAPQFFGDRNSATPQCAVVGPSSYTWRWIKHKKLSTTKHTNSVFAEWVSWDWARAQVLEEQAQRIATGLQSWQYCSQSTEVTLTFFDFQLLQLKAESLPSRLCCLHTQLGTSTANMHPLNFYWKFIF